MTSNVQLLYGALAMSASMMVFTYLQEREDQIVVEEKTSVRQNTSKDGFHEAVQSMELPDNVKRTMRRFWRKLRKAKKEKLMKAANDAMLENDTNNTLRQRRVGEHNNTNRTMGLENAKLQYSDEEIDQEIIMEDVTEFLDEYLPSEASNFPRDEILVAAEMALAEQFSNWNIVESTSTMIMSTGKRFQDIAKGTKGGMQLAVHRTVRKYLERALDVVAARLKDALKDPDMPTYLKDNIDMTVDQFIPDVKVEIFRKTRNLFGQEEAIVAVPVAGPQDATSRVIPIQLSILRRIRGHILYHLFPYNRSIWRSLKDPWWIFFTCIGIFPGIGQLWWLFLFLIKDKSNEHQLCQFIVGFKVAQFITLGIFYTFFGVSKYINCTIHGDMDMCMRGGPALENWNAFFFILQIAIVWTAFIRLPYTVRPIDIKAEYMERRDSDLRVSGIKIIPIYHDVFGNELHLDRGGYLMSFGAYETLSFAIIVTATLAIMWMPIVPWQRKALFYWVRTAYGVFSFPYLAFKIPVIANILMHTRRMGYNENGETVSIVEVQSN